MSSHLLSDIDSSWTLFLDRDGVINQKRDNDYVKTLDEFVFLPGTLEALFRLENHFAYHIVVTNQQGVGKGLMSHESLTNIHDFMIKEVERNNGHIDEVYYSAEIDGIDSFNRKPNPGMALQAQKDFPIISFNKSIMVGDSLSDMEFGKKLGMITVLVGQSNKGSNQYIDIVVDNLLEFSKMVINRHNKFSDDLFTSRQ